MDGTRTTRTKDADKHGFVLFLKVRVRPFYPHRPRSIYHFVGGGCPRTPFVLSFWCFLGTDCTEGTDAFFRKVVLSTVAPYSLYLRAYVLSHEMAVVLAGI